VPNLSFSDLEAGYEFPLAEFTPDKKTVEKYLSTVEGPEHDCIPPLAVSALALISLTESINLPPGSIHASQEFNFLKAVPVGTKLGCQTIVTRKTARSSMNMLVLEMNVFDNDGEKVQSGKTTIILPAMK
jgi:acyl dehydratase